MSILNNEYVYYQKGNKYLFIYPDIPYWLVVNENAKRLLELFKKRDDIESVVEEYVRRYNGDADRTRAAVQKIYDRLLEHKVIKTNYDNSVEWKGIIDTAGINITNNCNLRCTYCYADAGKEIINYQDEIDFNEIKKYLDGVKKYASENCYIQFTGGEPLLRKELLFKSIKYAREIELPKITINTNGILIDDEVARFFKEYSIDNITVSLDGIDKEKHDKFRGKGSYDYAIKAINILKKYNLNVTASMTVHKENFDYLEGFIEFCKVNGIQNFTSPLFPIGRCKEDDKLCHVPFNDLYNILSRWYSEGRFNQKDLAGTLFHTMILPMRDLTRRNYCGAGMSSIFMDANGDIYPCTNTIGASYFKCGNIYDQMFDEIWFNSETFKKVRNNINVDNIIPCKKCELRYICAGFCRGVTYKITGKINSPFPWCKEIKQSIINAMWDIGEHPDIYKGVKDKFA